MNKKVTSKKAASSASKTLTSKSTGTKSKTAAGSALSQVKATNKQTSAKAATAASKTLTDGRTSKTSKSAAGSALAQKSTKKAIDKKSDHLVTVTSMNSKTSIHTKSVTDSAPNVVHLAV